MPVTVHPAAHGASLIATSFSPFRTANALLRKCSASEHQKCTNIIQSSFTNLTASQIEASNNGFVCAVVEAYSRHHHLTIRPDDIWLAILTQFNIYVNAHSEEFRDMFVAHEGTKELEIVDSGVVSSYDWGKFARAITCMIERYIIDPELREWLVPDFTTTTEKDKVVYSIVMMSTLQKYLSSKCSLRCGLPSVTLLGEKGDWENILLRLEKLKTFGSETTQWYKLLVPVLKRFLATFDEPDSEANKDFWQKIAHESGGGSGPTYLSGWITAFCFWGDQCCNLYARDIKYNKPHRLELDGEKLHYIDMEDIAPGWSAVPVKVDDHGHMMDTRMVAGHVGMRCESSGCVTNEGKVGLDSVQPEVGWWIFEV